MNGPSLHEMREAGVEAHLRPMRAEMDDAIKALRPWQRWVLRQRWLVRLLAKVAR